MVYFWGFPVTRSTTTRFDCMASWGFDDYLSEGGTWSPWLAVEGWHFKTACHDPMHVVFLGICRDLYPSTMAYWMRNNFFGTGPIKERLLQFSAQLRCDCRKEKILSIFLEVFNCLQYFVAFTSGISRLFFFGWYTSDPIFQQVFVQSRIQLSRIQLTFKRFTPSNTGLDSGNKYPELASTFKAAFVKSALWFYAKMALKICEDHPTESQLKS